MKSKQKFLGIGSAVSLGLYALFPLIYALLLQNGVLADNGDTVLPFLLASGLSSAIGTGIGCKSDCAVMTVALCAGLAPQGLLLLIGWILFPKGFIFASLRWSLPLVSFLASVTVGLTVRGRTGRKRKRKIGRSRV